VETIHVNADATITKIVSATFPGYRGRKFKIQVHEAGGMSLKSCWDGGSRDYFSVLRLEDMKGALAPVAGAGRVLRDASRHEDREGRET
jgi:hypothetical protein